MKVFVTGVNGQLGHDVMIELAKRGCLGIGSDLQVACIWDASVEYKQLDITDASAV